ncbi:MAG: hypothetical protein LBF43_01105 [Puniceicoccales bacterium]|nr:hypothetical protein [Puniceicoccales bacterium]
MGGKFFCKKRGIGEFICCKNNEKRLILDALLECGDDKVKSAQLLGIPRITLHKKLEKL